jgi:transposase
MKVSQWAEIRRLHEVEGLSQRGIARRLGCDRTTVRKALAMTRAPDETRRTKRGSILDPYKKRIDAMVTEFPELSAVRIWEEICRGPDGYRGSVITVRRYVRKIRPARGRVYQEVHYDPGQAMQVDWGHCGQIRIENTSRKVSVFVAVLCYSRMSYIEFTLSQRKAEFYRAIVHALEFFGGSPRRIIFDNLRAAVMNGSGRHACLHPEFLALCGHFYMEPIACARRDPESKGIVEAQVRYVKHNALQGRAEQLTTWQDYQQLAVRWRDEVANVRLHQATGQRPVDRFELERPHLRGLPPLPFDTDEIVATMVNSHARVKFDGNRYSTPPDYVGKPVMIRAGADSVRILHEGGEIACHPRCYGRGLRICQTEHQLQALQRRRRTRGRHLEETFDALGEVAREFHLKLQGRPVKTSHHLRRLLKLVRLYGRAEVLAAIARACQYQTYDAAYVETILLQERRRQELPSPTPLRPQRPELIDEIDVEDPDPAAYDRLLGIDQDEPDEKEPKEDDQTG